MGLPHPPPSSLYLSVSFRSSHRQTFDTEIFEGSLLNQRHRVSLKLERFTGTLAPCWLFECRPGKPFARRYKRRNKLFAALTTTSLLLAPILSPITEYLCFFFYSLLLFITAFIFSPKNLLSFFAVFFLSSRYKRFWEFFYNKNFVSKLGRTDGLSSTNVFVAARKISWTL